MTAPEPAPHDAAHAPEQAQELPLDAEVVVLQDDTGLRLTLVDWGAAWWSLHCPVPGEPAPRELLLGGATPRAQRDNGAYFGATIGRYANRIAGAVLHRDGERRPLLTAPGLNHQLHGGPDGFHRRRWACIASDTRHVRYALHSPDGDQGYPGALDVELVVALPGRGVIELGFEARASAPTPVALTNHSYFNLDGLDRPDAGPEAKPDVRRHRLQLAAGWWLPVDEHLLPAGAPQAVDGTRYDFREPLPLRAGPGDGDLDHAFLLDGAATADGRGPLHPAARLWSADGRVRLAIETTMPALQVYSGRWLDRERGRDRRPLPAHAAIALEPGWLPDSPHHPEWPQPGCWLAPGQIWRHRIRYTVAVDADRAL